MLVLYDRKSPRHHWQIFCGDNTLDRLAMLSANSEKKLKDRPGWEKYQTSITSQPDDYPHQLPPNACAGLIK
jgi:hypothetical protein